MKIYSDTLTRADLSAAVQTVNQARPVTGHRAAFGVHDGHIGFERCERIGRPRIRKNGWSVSLFRVGSRMHFNTGRFGAGDEGAASWDDWGHFLAALYELDPDAHVGADVPGAGYDSRDDFHKQTYDGFRVGGSPRMLTKAALERVCELGFSNDEARSILAVARRTYTPAYRVRPGGGGKYAVRYYHGRFQVTTQPAG